ncbi:hypothetical protein, conserved [Trypanosoma brucei gambiense DAL972]|uniref:Uncharacterized protein n=1 Tax=Trypanosoma brucei gambiense (strain MHOM/CI/86/DAL972) TaxID=679716 RepID=D0AA92_TRYB9|nr:hypothetical protein, conserved [Trypanosoma brucei gambiense DAL972]CBH18593.1 hypothetical protein, conserved [Trypanosoma brucei gambiense DAL972]|eukprot:XP_011780857.1 hypothetical protein, conserved [Trypanosoma brucei gambiense DAL972]
MHLPPLPKNQKPRTARCGTDSVVQIDDSTLLSMFRTRRRRMETASNISKSMVKRINNLSEAVYESSMTTMLLEDLNTLVETSGANGGEKVVISDDPVMSLGAGPFSVSLESALEHETIQKLRTLTVMRAEQRKAAELNTKPHFQLKESVLETPQPPIKFSSTSLTFVLEIVSQSAFKILDATDSVMLKLSMLARKAGSPIVDEMKVISVHSQHLSRCHAAALSHLKQYEACEKCLNKATAYELGNAREQLIEQKEVLTAQEKRQKVAEDQLQALRTRLASYEAQCRLWSSFLYERQHPASTGGFPISLETESASPLTSKAASLRAPQASLHSTDPLLRTTSGLRRGSSTYQMNLHTMRPHTPLTMGSVSSSLPSSHEEINPRVDSVEMRVAQFWCNPYLLKAKQCRNWRRSGAHSVADGPPLTESIFQASISRSRLASRVESSVGPVDSAHMSRGDIHAGGSTDLSDTNTADTRLTVLLRGLLRGIVRLRRRPTNEGGSTGGGREESEEVRLEGTPTSDSNAPRGNATTEEGSTSESSPRGSLHERGVGEGSPWAELSGSEGGNTSIGECSAGPGGAVNTAGGTPERGTGTLMSEGSGEADALLASVRKLISFLEGRVSLS